MLAPRGRIVLSKHFKQDVHHIYTYTASTQKILSSHHICMISSASCIEKYSSNKKLLSCNATLQNEFNLTSNNVL